MQAPGLRVWRQPYTVKFLGMLGQRPQALHEVTFSLVVRPALALEERLTSTEEPSPVGHATTPPRHHGLPFLFSQEFSLGSQLNTYRQLVMMAAAPRELLAQALNTGAPPPNQSQWAEAGSGGLAQ